MTDVDRAGTFEVELAQIEAAANRLRRLAVIAATPETGVTSEVERESDARLAMLAARILRLRRERDSLFGASLFADPAWDMLLDLFAQRRHGRQISVSSLGIAAAVPPTTALRYMTTLEAEGLIVRNRAREDTRKRYVELTPVACEKLRSWLVRAEALGSGQ